MTVLKLLKLEKKKQDFAQTFRFWSNLQDKTTHIRSQLNY